MSPIKPAPERDPKNKCIMGIDSSSTGVAWTILWEGRATGLGKIDLSKIKEVPEKLFEIVQELTHILKENNIDYVFVEKSIFVKNPATARLLSYVVGTIMATCCANGVPVVDVEPMSWKSWLGYTNISSKFVTEAKKVLGNTEGKKLCDRLRKSQTWRVIRHNYPDDIADFSVTDDNDISDSWGIALYGYNRVGQEVVLEKSKAIAIDYEELAKLGLSM